MEKAKQLKDKKSTRQIKFEYDYESNFSSVEAFIKFYEQYRNSGQKQQLCIRYPIKPTKITFPNRQANAYLTFLFMLNLAKKNTHFKKVIIYEEPYD